MNNEVEIAVEVLHTTDGAILVTDGNVEEWVPKSQITDYSTDKNGQYETIFLPEWLAISKGFL